MNPKFSSNCTVTVGEQLQRQQRQRIERASISIAAGLASREGFPTELVAEWSVKIAQKVIDRVDRLTLERG